MRNRLAVMSGAIVLLAAITCLQANPITGNYQGPGMFDGRWSESYIGGGPSQVGNEVRAGSWDGATLGSQWALSGAILKTDSLESNQIFGNGMQFLQYYTTYEGGTLTLESGPWTAGGDGNYTVDIDSFSQTTIVTLYKGLPLGPITALISMQGTFPAFSGYTMSYLAASTSIVGQGATPPAGYPSLSAATGQWGGVQGVQMQIVPEPASMALLVVAAPFVLLWKRSRRRSR